jgi:hypothetical protein
MSCIAAPAHLPSRKPYLLQSAAQSSQLVCLHCRLHLRTDLRSTVKQMPTALRQLHFKTFTQGRNDNRLTYRIPSPLCIRSQSDLARHLFLGYLSYDVTEVVIYSEGSVQTLCTALSIFKVFTAFFSPSTLIPGEVLKLLSPFASGLKHVRFSALLDAKRCPWRTNEMKATQLNR